MLCPQKKKGTGLYVLIEAPKSARSKDWGASRTEGWIRESILGIYCCIIIPPHT